MTCESSASLISSPASEASASVLNEPADSKPSPSAKSRTTPAASSPSTGPMSPSTTMSAPSQPMLFDETELPSMSSAAGSRARIFHSLENGLALKVRALVCGDSMPASLANYDPASSSWRTSQACFLSEWEPFSETWPRSGMMRRGTAYQLPPLAPLTDEIGSGLLPTPTAEQYGSNQSPSPGAAVRPSLSVIAKLPTPTAKANMLAPSMQKWAAHRNLWPTPTAVTDTGGAAMCKWGGSGARAKLRKMVTPQELNGSLNPMWVEWLMGFPLGWTDLGASATPSSLKSPSSSAARSLKRKG